ncbi:glycosyltransferase family 2 protein [Hydrogenophaga sp. MI9]|uniref:glycosyltransferase family 2 protein n=1 Tax=Hydrogenophaga sp. MI9 TaxID=3453719 RepID=UPI003EEF5541
MAPRPTPAVSIVTATHDRSRALAIAIETVRRQTFTDWELIVVGDACTDDTEAVVAAVGDPRIRYVRMVTAFGEQAGPNNLGVAHARAPLIAFLNHDDLWFPDHLEASVAWLHATAADLVFTSNANITPDPGFRGDFEHVRVYVDALTGTGVYVPLGPERMCAPCSTWTLRRSLFDAMRGFRAARDCIAPPTQDFLYRAHRAGHVLRNVPHLGVITVASGDRPGSYADGRADEQAFFLERLGDAGLRAELLARAWNDTVTFGPGRRAWHAILARLGAIGIDPFALDYLVRRRERRGTFIDQLRRLRGLAPLDDGGTPVERLRAREARRTAPVPFGIRLPMCTRSVHVGVLAAGWHAPEPWGTWCSGDRSRILLRLEEPPVDGVVVVLEGRPYVGPGEQGRALEIRAAGQTLRSTRERADDRTITVRVPRSGIRGRLLTLELCSPDARSPASLGAGGDDRVLAYGLEAITVLAP